MSAFQYQDEDGNEASGPSDSDIDLAFDIIRDAVQDPNRIRSQLDADRMEIDAGILRERVLHNRRPAS